MKYLKINSLNTQALYNAKMHQLLMFTPKKMIISIVGNFNDKT